MGLDRAVQKAYPYFFTVVFMFGVINLTISGWLVSRYNNRSNFTTQGQRDRVRYWVFVGAWTVLVTPIMMSLFIFAKRSRFASILSHLLFLFITWVIWIAGASALTQATGGGLNCSHNDMYRYCGQLNTLIAIGYINWILLTFLFCMCLLMGVRSFKREDGLMGSLIATNGEEKH